jgi:predicted phosphoribosyltransferase
MKDNGQQRRASRITVGDVQGTGIVIGNHSSVSVDLQQSRVQHDAAAMLDEFIRLLEVHQSSVADAAEIRESAAVARAELDSPSPRWHVVRTVLRGVSTGVTSVAALAEAVDKVQALIAHLA